MSLTGESEIKAIVIDYFQAVYDRLGLSDPEIKSVIGSQVVDLVVTTVDRAREGAQAASPRGVRATRYRQILDEIRRRFAEPMLNGERIARTLGISHRYVQHLFEENGRTLSSAILDERLKAARHALTDPACDGMKISQIAFDCGFSDLSYFNRAYRQKYGETPKAARQTSAPPMAA